MKNIYYLHNGKFVNYIDVGLNIGVLIQQKWAKKMIYNNILNNSAYTYK